MMPWKRGGSAVTVALVMVAFSGCLDEPVDDVTDLLGADDLLKDVPAWALGLEDCEIGGFVAVYPMSQGATVGGVWALADVREELGNPMRNGYGLPLDSIATGNWHLGFRCATAHYGDDHIHNLQMGWVGRLVEAPDWDPGGADVHYILAGFGIQGGPVLDGLSDATMADITTALEAQVTWIGEAAVLTVYDDEHKGTYESRSLIEKYRDLDERVHRFWWLVPDDGSRSHLGRGGHGHEEVSAGALDDEAEAWNPVFWDMIASPGVQYTTPRIASVEVACHWQEGAHGPQGGACQPTLTTVYQHASLQFEYGKVFEDIRLDRAWTH